MTLIHRLVVSPPPKNMCQLRWLFPIYGKIKAMFQTTNQSTINQSAKYGRFQATHFVHPRRSRTTRGWHRVDGSAALARSVVCYVLFTENQWDICDIFMNSGLLWFVMKIMWTFEIYEPIHRTWWRSMMNGTWWTFFYSQWNRKYLGAQCGSFTAASIYDWRTTLLTTSYYPRWTWPKWVVPYRLWRFVLTCYLQK